LTGSSTSGAVTTARHSGDSASLYSASEWLTQQDVEASRCMEHFSKHPAETESGPRATAVCSHYRVLVPHLGADLCKTQIENTSQPRRPRRVGAAQRKYLRVPEHSICSQRTTTTFWPLRSCLATWEAARPSRCPRASTMIGLSKPMLDKYNREAQTAFRSRGAFGGSRFRQAQNRARGRRFEQVRFCAGRIAMAVCGTPTPRFLWTSTAPSAAADATFGKEAALATWWYALSERTAHPQQPMATGCGVCGSRRFCVCRGSRCARCSNRR
jgi:hypothetical protein